jgi:hypothetical protein
MVARNVLYADTYEPIAERRGRAGVAARCRICSLGELSEEAEFLERRRLPGSAALAEPYAGDVADRPQRPEPFPN